MPQGQTSWAWRVRIVELSRRSENPATELSNRAKKLFSRAKKCLAASVPTFARPGFYVMAVTKKRFFPKFGCNHVLAM